MNFIMQKSNKQKAIILLTFVFVTALSVLATLKSTNQIWADKTGMTQIRFNSTIFCSQVASAIENSLSSGSVDGSDCVNYNLYVSSDKINEITTLNVTPPPNGLPSNLSTPINIGGEWMTAFRSMTELSITNMNVQDISQLEILANRLTYLDLSGNPIKTGLRNLSFFSNLKTLKLKNTGLTSITDLFKPITKSENGGIQPSEEEEIFTSKLAQALTTFDISNNEKMSKEKNTYSNDCTGNLSPFKTYTDKNKIPEDYRLNITELYAFNNNLNQEDVLCISYLKTIEKLDVSNNHIEDFNSIRNKSYTELKVDSQTLTRTIEGLDYNLLPTLFIQAQQDNYFNNIESSGIELGDIVLDNAEFFHESETTIRIKNALIASPKYSKPHPATLTVPEGSGPFEKSKLQIYFDGQLVTFNDSDLCNRVYEQGFSKSAFRDINGNYSTTDEIVLTNACTETEKQIAMVKSGSSKFRNLDLNNIRSEDEHEIDLTGMENFTGLQWLSIEGNNLSDLSALSKATSLQQLYADNNYLNTTDAWNTITKLTNLSLLYLNNNHIYHIPSTIGKLSRLGGLYLANNEINSSDSYADLSSLSKATHLTALDLSGNKNLTDFSDLAQNDSACTPMLLKIENSGITSIPDYDTMEQISTNLTNLNLIGNKLTDESIANLAAASKLEQLYLANNEITSTSVFSELTTLQKLTLDSNKITNISGLLSLDSLSELHLKNNYIDDISGLEALPSLATIDLKNQTLSKTITDLNKSIDLPAIFSQAITFNFPKVSDFKSAGNYTITNGTIDYDEMTAKIEDISNPMIITIPDGGLAETTLTIYYEDNQDFTGQIVNNVDNSTLITTTSSNSFTIISDKACTVLLSYDNGTTWSKLDSQKTGENNKRKYIVNQADRAQINIFYTGDINLDKKVNAKDATEILKAKVGKTNLSNIKELLADVDHNQSVQAKDAGKILKVSVGNASFEW